MDKALLAYYLDQGLSLPQIGVLVDRDPSTVGYWVQKHGLVANGREKYAPRGGLGKDQLEPLVQQRLSTREMAASLGVSISTVRHWLKKYDLPTDRAYRRRQDRLEDAHRTGVTEAVMECQYHGSTNFVLDNRGGWRCRKCGSLRVAARRRRVKEILVAEAGGRCVLCAYARYRGALQFHHLDPGQKEFSISRRGITRGIAEVREEAKKCVLLCANCHAEVEAGLASLDAVRGEREEEVAQQDAA